MTHSRHRMVRNLQIWPTVKLLRRVGTGLTVTPIIYWLLNGTGQVVSDPVTWVPVGVRWMMLGAYVHVLAQILAGRLGL